MKYLKLSILFVVFAITQLFAQDLKINELEEALQTPIKSHPRLLMTKGQEDIIKENIAKNPSAKFLNDKIIARADEMIKLPPAERKMEGRRLDKGVATEKVIYPAYAYRITRDKKYLDSAVEQMLTSAEYTDWNPPHFLCASAMMTSVAIGYDWLYDDISPENRKTIETALYKKGLEQGARRVFVQTYNWNSVCNGATIYAAIALFDLYPDVSKRAILKCVTNNELCFPQYAPNGNYCEGAGYWRYGTSYQIFLIAALESLYGSDFGYYSKQGFIDGAMFVRSALGSSGKTYNYSDNRENALSFCFENAYLGLKSGDLGNIIPLEKDDDKSASGLSMIMNMIFLSDVDLFQNVSPKWLSYFGEGDTPVAMVRTSWNDDEALYLGIKGSSGSAHSHPDTGSFVFDTGSIRWVSDMNITSYHQWEKIGLDLFGKDSKRAKLLRFNSASHNVLLVNKKNVSLSPKSPMVEQFDTDAKRGAKFNTTGAYERKKIKTATREGVIIDNSYLQITDTIEANKEVDLRWNLATEAKATIIDSTSILLEKDGKQLIIKMVSNSIPVRAEIFPVEKLIENDYDIDEYTLVGFSMKAPAHKALKFTTTLKPVK